MAILQNSGLRHRKTKLPVTKVSERNFRRVMKDESFDKKIIYYFFLYHFFIKTAETLVYILPDDVLIVAESLLYAFIL